VAAAFFMALINGAAAYFVSVAVQTGQRLDVERRGKIVVSRNFLDVAQQAVESSPALTGQFLDLHVPHEANRIAEKYGGKPAEIADRLREAIRQTGTQDLVTREEASPGLSALAKSGGLAAMLGSVALLWWVLMLVFQGEGLELDLQRRRHPMWEWLFSHPVPAGGVFLAEMLSPVAANPMYWAGPLFVIVLYWFVYGASLALLAGVLIGIPVTVAAACLGKALEIGVILRFSPRTRGAMIGLMGWLGYASMMLFLLGFVVVDKLTGALGKVLTPFARLPWPWLRLFLGGRTDGTFSFTASVLTCEFAAAVVIAGAVWLGVWGAQQGLSGNFAGVDAGPAPPRAGETRFARDPLYRKEFLWFIRDRSAIVQTILIPLTVASVQIFNLRGVLSQAQGAWNYLCGTAILFGTYFLWVLGPKSLSSEGNALWIALTWPRGLESLLKAKAWLWSLISSGIVALVLIYAAFQFPAEIWKISLVGVGWFFFGRSMAEKAVTLVTVTSPSGEPEKIPWGRRAAAQLGMLTFSIGVLTQQWNIAVVGIVYSYVTAAAMWESFRARLPYLYDPWSEKLPPPPTLLHAMVAISILVEGGAVITGIAIAVFGRDNLAVAQAFGYAVSAVAVSLGVAHFLDKRGVGLREVWEWPAKSVAQMQHWWRGEEGGFAKLLLLLCAGAAAGLALGFFARGYSALLEQLPGIGETVRQGRAELLKVPNLKLSFAVMAVAFAPFAEEYLFRGLLFRALDREWGGWRAILGSAAFFASYHPPLAWLPVAMLGAINAWLFKKTGRLAPAVILHMVYNAVVLR
jgi:membrane protease YdiL (CAAX protease family)